MKVSRGLFDSLISLPAFFCVSAYIYIIQILNICLVIFTGKGVINILQNIQFPFLINKALHHIFWQSWQHYCCTWQAGREKRILELQEKINPWGKQCSCPAINHYNELCSTAHTLLYELNLSIYQRPTETSQMFLWRQMPAGSARSPPALPDLSQHALVQSTAGSQHVCSGIFIQQSPTAKTLSRKKMKVKRPKAPHPPSLFSPRCSI